MSYRVFPKDHICNTATKQIIELQKPLQKIQGLHLVSYGCYYPKDHTGFLFYTNRPYWAIRRSLKVPFPGTYLEDKAIHPWSEHHSQSFIKIAEDFSIFEPINFITPFENKRDAFTFAFSEKDNPGLSFYFTNIDLLKKFMDYFRQEAEPLILEAEKTRVVVPDHLRNPEQETMDYKATVSHLLANFSIPEEVKDKKNDMNKLTEREFLCLCYYLMGKTAAEIAQMLNMSPKTASTHLYNVRIKLDCKNRSELFKKAWDLGLVHSHIIDMSLLDES